MPIPKDYTPIIRQLLSKTRDGKVLWQKGRFNTFSVTVAGTSFDIWSGTDEESGTDFISFGLSDPGTHTPTKIDSWSVDEGDEWFSMMSDLYAEARRYALGIPERLNALEAALKKSDVVGKDDEDIPF